MKFVAIAAFAAGMAALTANAATFDFKAASTGGWSNGITYAPIDGIGLKVSGTTTTGAAAKVQTWKGYGLGVKSSEDCDSGWSGTSCVGDDHQVDSTGPDDIAVFSFDHMVKVVSISFNYVDKGDTFDFYIDGLASLVNQTVGNVVKMDTIFAEAFGVGADAYCYKNGHVLPVAGCKAKYLKNSAFKITSITVEKQMPPVPLPASALLLAGALGGLGLWRRLSHKAA